MREQKILDKKQVNWYEEQEYTRLDYQSIFQDKEDTEDQTEPDDQTEEPEEEKEDIRDLLRERDRMWKIRLKNAREDAYARGFEDGSQQGIEEARAEIDSKLASLEGAFEKAHKEWQERQTLLNPGLLDLVFDITESILEIPVENTDIRKKLDRELGKLLKEVDEHSRPSVWVSESDYEYVEKLKEKKGSHATIHINISKECNPGEFKIETDRETVIHNFRIMLSDFKDNLSLPSWK